MKIQKCIQFFVCLLTIAVAHGEETAPENLHENPCHSHQTCNYCLYQAGCAWCGEQDFKRGYPRCDHAQILMDNGCHKEFIMNVSSSFKVVQDNPFSVSSENSDNAVQLRPQSLDIVLRPGEPVRFNITFRQAENYPVDLYYLMDLTYSMKEHKEKVSELADALAASMKNITTNFRLGFGSFIDKVVMPYADMVPERLKNPCRDYPCVSPYGFRNHLALDKNVAKFREEVATANLSGNLDNAEGGFDAIMQVVVCKNQIGWNMNSRKIIIFATDSIFHQAGDGKLGGVVKANDGQCHLDSLGYYTQSIHQDYPALSQLNSKLIDSKTNILFAVPRERMPLYKTLSSNLEGAYAAELSLDSANIVDLIQEQYHKIRSEVKLIDNAASPVKIRYFSKCLGESMEQVNSCAGLQIGDTVSFEVEVELESCPLDPSTYDQIVTVYPVGLGEIVTLNLKYICECDCQNDGKANNEKCSGNGTLACGVCNCNSNRFGMHCECTGDDLMREEKLAQCRMTPDSKACSELGDCVCGKCECYPPKSPGSYIYGQFCECNSNGCAKDDSGQVCGGPLRGKCCQEKCVCAPGWSGDVCDCTSDQSTCIAPEDVETSRLCSGRGECVCGRCKCKKSQKGIYGGNYCQDCATCEGRCAEFAPCVECLAYETGPLSGELCQHNCSAFADTITMVEAHFEPGRDEKRCIFQDDYDCTFEFFYGYDSDNNPYCLARRNKVCPKVAEVWIIVVGTVGGVFLLGMVILCIVRFVLYVKDKQDYERFQEELKNVKWGTREDNPIYKKATSKYQNPLYNTEGL